MQKSKLLVIKLIFLLCSCLSFFKYLKLFSILVKKWFDPWSASEWMRQFTECSDGTNALRRLCYPSSSVIRFLWNYPWMTSTWSCTRIEWQWIYGAPTIGLLGLISAHTDYCYLFSLIWFISTLKWLETNSWLNLD
jgi:hypothetical protein